MEIGQNVQPDTPRDMAEGPAQELGSGLTHLRVVGLQGAAAQLLAGLVEPVVAGHGLALVRLQLSGGARRQVLQVMVERIDGATITVDDCAHASRALSAVLDVEDPIGGAYMLEVSSPGIDRPLTRRADFERYSGHQARVELDPPLDGRRRFTGQIEGVDGAYLMLATEEADLRLPLANLAKAKLVLTDALLAEAAASVEDEKTDG